MTYDQMEPFLGKAVVVTYMDGRHFQGVFTNTESEFDTASGKEEMELDAGTFCYGLPLDEITDMVEIPCSEMLPEIEHELAHGLPRIHLNGDETS